MPFPILNEEEYIASLQTAANALLFQAFLIQNLYVSGIPQELKDDIAKYALNKALEYNYGPKDSS